jgi:hypothetical protein
MPVRSNNLLQESQDFYQAAIGDLVEDIPVGNGLYRPQLNFTELVRRVAEKPKLAQITVQMLHQMQDQSEEEQRVTDLHGTWMMAALIVAFGMEDASVQSVRMNAARYYEAAVTLLRDVQPS